MTTKRKVIWALIGVIILGLGFEIVRRWPRPLGELDFSPMALLAYEDVQKELHLSNEQIAQIKALTDKYDEVVRESLSKGVSQERRAKASKDMMNGLLAVLRLEQNKRFFQLTLQQEGPAIFFHFGVAPKLELTREQRDRIEAILKRSADTRSQLYKDLKTRHVRRAERDWPH